ncbi:hypothetical protein PAHAL_4G286200 [Panicum hallii]|jgi:hypothetical protein|uniref:EF-hand domain-containing protein n=1 Tax=Panicum hallii TaxID=206008 RepID=A0A2S3HKY4_9POAL|nr:hypothetical protein PAHAL_4G286200 [Panicum hallii]
MAENISEALSQAPLADLDRHIHITWRQSRPARSVPNSRESYRAAPALQVAKARMELEGCEGQADSTQQWGSKGKGLLQHPFCFLPNHSGQLASPGRGCLLCLCGLDRRPAARHVSVAGSTSNFQQTSRASARRNRYATLSLRIQKLLVECGYTQGEDFLHASFNSGRYRRINLSEFKTLLAPGVASFAIG